MRYSYVPESEAAHAARIRPWLTSDRAVTPPPRVTARSPLGPHEFADKRQAGTLGRLAISLGWKVKAYYWQAHDGTEGCALRLCRVPLSAVAVWRRAPGDDSWSSDVAYAWNTDLRNVPVNVGARRLTELIKQMGQVG